MQGLACSSPAVPTCGRQQCLAGPPFPAARSAAAIAARRSRQAQRHQRGDSRAPASSLDDVAAAAAAAAGVAGGEQPPSGSDDDDLEGEMLDYVQHCQDTYGRPGLIDFSPGVNGLPKATLQHPAGPTCEVYLHGAAVTSWRHSDGREMLHVRDSSPFNGKDPIRGGIQIAWPQYGVGALPTHGFLQHLHWSVVDTAWREPEAEQQFEAAKGLREEQQMLDWRPTLSLYASTDEEWEQQWPHKFEALYSVTLMQPDPPEPSDLEVMQEVAEYFQPWKRRQRQEASGKVAAAAAAAATAAAAAATRQPAAAAAAAAGASSVEEKHPPATPSILRCLLQVHNCDDVPFTFTTGLRTHFATRDIPLHHKFVRALGLRGKIVLDYTRNPLSPGFTVWDEHYVRFGDMAPQNRLFVDCDEEGEVLFCPGSVSHFNIGNEQGFSDIAVVHPTGVAARESRRFVEFDSARAVRKVTLQPGATWVGEMVLTAYDRYWDLPAWEMEDTSGVPIPDQAVELLPRRLPATELYCDDT